MRFLRTAPTRRLLAVIAGIVAAIGGTAAIAVAATSGGPVPPPEPLATAVHDALGAPAVSGVTAQITFTNNLITSSQIQGSDPLLTGASGRLWIAPHHLRLELQSSNGDGQVVVDGQSFWIYDPSSNTVYEGTLPTKTSSGSNTSSGSETSSTTDQIPTIAQIQTEIDKLAAHLTGLSAVPTDVAGQPAYSVSVSPKASGGLLGSVQLAWDAAHGVPLSFSIYAKGDPNPVISLQATNISYGAVPSSVFAISPPTGATVVNLTTSGQSSTSGSSQTASPITAVAPGSAGGLALTSNKSVGHGDGALLTYGQGPGAVHVLERAASSGSGALPGQSQAGGSGGSQLTLPTVQIGGASATELSTALGTALEFKQGGLDYIVFGSVPAPTAIAVARGL